MPLSLLERESVLAHIEERVVGRNIPRQITRAAVERVCSVFSTSEDRLEKPAGGGEILVALSAASMPDLASRVRRKTMATDITPADTEIGRIGRRSEIVRRRGAGHEPVLRRAAAIVGCNTHCLTGDRAGRGRG